MGGQKGIAFFYEYLSPLLPVTIILTGNNDFPKNSAASFLPLLSNSRARYINPALFIRMKNIIREQKFTHLVLEHPYFGWLGMLLKRYCNVTLVLHSHNIEALRFKSTGKWWWRILFHYEKMTHRQADINFFITDEDRLFAISTFKLAPGKCHTITYGFDFNQIPSSYQRMEAKKYLQQAHGIAPAEKILFFNGTLDYKPNLDAVNIILKEINPRLLKNRSFRYRIIICGKNLPTDYKLLEAYSEKNIIYAGFVKDINIYFQGTDIFLNPVTDGAGIKTKLVEALGADLFCVSTVSGAIGVSKELTGKKLQIVADGNWDNFTNAIFEGNENKHIPEAFFDHFYWGNIARKAADILTR